MKIIKPHSDIVPTDGMPRIKMMEKAGRICYRLENKINDKSAEDFIKNIISRKHWSVTEFAVYTLKITADSNLLIPFLQEQHKYLIIDRVSPHVIYVTGTVRGFRECFNKFFEIPLVDIILYVLKEEDPIFFFDLSPVGFIKGESPLIQILSPEQVDTLVPELLKRHRWAMVKHVVNRAVSHELVRHRPVSWLQESQRYCCYAQERFGSEITFIDPRGAFPQMVENAKLFKTWKDICNRAEKAYLQTVKPKGSLSPQAARTMLPNSCKTALYQFCNLEEWEIFFNLRTSAAAEPSMREVIVPLKKQFEIKWPSIFPS